MTLEEVIAFVPREFLVYERFLIETAATQGMTRSVGATLRKN